MKRVPWISTNEWLDVKNNLVADDLDSLKSAYNTLLMWKARNLLLPVNVECTFTIVQALLQCEEEPPPESASLFAHDTRLQLSFATALVRFMNHVSSAWCPRGDSLYSTARRQNIPDWVVNLRHDVSHSSSLPPFRLLHEALCVAKQWLLENYWNVVEEKPVSIVNNESVSRSPCKGLYECLHAAVHIWQICSRLIVKGVTASRDIGSADWCAIRKLCQDLESSGITPVSSIVELLSLQLDAEDKCRSLKEPSALKISKIRKRVAEIIKAIAQRKRQRKLLLPVLLTTDFLMDGSAGIHKWLPILQILHGIDHLEALLEHLFTLLSTGDCNEVKAAEGWLTALASPLIQAQDSETKENTKADDSNARAAILFGRAPELRLDCLRPALMRCSAKNVPLLLDYCKLVRPSLSAQTIFKLKSLMELNNNELEEAPPVDDVSVTLSCVRDVPEETVDVVALGSCKGSWTVPDISDLEVWHKTPMGLLPGQKDPQLELPSLSWTSSQHSSKRKLYY